VTVLLRVLELKAALADTEGEGGRMTDKKVIGWSDFKMSCCKRWDLTLKKSECHMAPEDDEGNAPPCEMERCPIWEKLADKDEEAVGEVVIIPPVTDADRDPESPCDHWQKRESGDRRGDCPGDGHYRCPECREWEGAEDEKGGGNEVIRD
jgi:hypothetical protein